MSGLVDRLAKGWCDPATASGLVAATDDARWWLAAIVADPEHGLIISADARRVLYEDIPDLLAEVERLRAPVSSQEGEAVEESGWPARIYLAPGEEGHDRSWCADQIDRDWREYILTPIHDSEPSRTTERGEENG